MEPSLTRCLKMEFYLKKDDELNAIEVSDITAQDK